VLRAYNEGVACRYELPKQPGLAEVTGQSAATEYALRKTTPFTKTEITEYGKVKIEYDVRSENNVTLDIGKAITFVIDRR